MEVCKESSQTEYWQCLDELQSENEIVKVMHN